MRPSPTWLAFLLFVVLAVKGRDFQTLARIAPFALLNPVHLGRDLDRSTVLSNCTAESCGGRRNPELYNKIKSDYSHLFMSKSAIQRLDCSTGRSERRRAERGQCRPNVDNDRCCVTRSEFIPVRGAKRDIHGQQCYIVSVGNLYQVIHVGRCDPEFPGACGSAVHGRCVQEKKYVTLLCWTYAYTLDFRLFEVDGYCSCRHRYNGK